MNQRNKTVLITGATGFIGGHLAAYLLEQGMSVRGIGRNLEKGKLLASRGVDFRMVDLRDLDEVRNAIEGAAVVVHCGALTSVWARRQDYWNTNVAGTRNVIEGCLQHGVSRLVYVSSASVMSRFRDQYDQKESDSPIGGFTSMYARSKHEAELLVSNAGERGLDTVILRPRAVYGPGDSTIVPRLLRAAERRWLPVIGNGSTVTNLTHVDDVSRAIRLALDTLRASGGVYVIAGDEVVNIWDVISELLNSLGYRPPAGRISRSVAYGFAVLAEGAWRSARLAGEPPITRYMVGLLGYSHTFDTTAARIDLGFSPRVKIQDGMTQLISGCLKTGDASGWKSRHAVEARK
jgi:nucleoside-diphosphate-sugar epimerase